MKLKCDFVTNSSSVCYVVTAPNKELKDNMIALVEKIGRLPIASNEGASATYIGSTLKELIEYTQDGKPWDWASEPRGVEFINLGEHSYEKCKEYIDEGYHIMIVRIDWNANHYFDEAYEDYILDSLY